MKNKRNIYSGYVNENQKYFLLRKYINEAIGNNETIKFDKEKEKEYIENLKKKSGRSHEYLSDKAIRDRNEAQNKLSQEEISDLKDTAIKTFEKLFSSNKEIQTKAERSLRGRFLNSEYANFYFFHIPTNVEITSIFRDFLQVSKEDIFSEKYLETGKEKIDRISYFNIKKSGGAASLEKLIKNAKIYQVMYLESLKEKESSNPKSVINTYNPNQNRSGKLDFKEFYTGLRLNFKVFFNDVMEKFKSMTGAEKQKSDVLFEMINLIEKVKNVFEKDQDAIAIINYGMHNEIFQGNDLTFISRTPWMIAHRLFDNSISDRASISRKNLQGLTSSHTDPKIAGRDNLLNKTKESNLSGFLAKKILEDTRLFINIARQQYPDRKLQKINFSEWKNVEKICKDKYPKNIAIPRLQKIKNTEWAYILPRFFGANAYIKIREANKETYSENPDKEITESEFSRIFNIDYRGELQLNLSNDSDIPGSANLFKPQNFNTDKHIFNANADYVNEIMTYYLGRVVNVEGDKYVIREKGQNRTVGILELSKEIFLPEIIQAYENDEDFINMLQGNFAPAVKKSIEAMIEIIETYKGKMFLLRS
jgi:hypothetical protein